MIYLKTTWNVIALAAVWGLSIIAIGIAARVAVWLFCVGYGCWK